MPEERWFFLLFLSDVAKSYLIDFTILIAPETISIAVLIAFNTKNTMIARHEVPIKRVFDALFIGVCDSHALSATAFFMITCLKKYVKENKILEKKAKCYCGHKVPFN